MYYYSKRVFLQYVLIKKYQYYAIDFTRNIYIQETTLYIKNNFMVSGNREDAYREISQSVDNMDILAPEKAALFAHLKTKYDEENPKPAEEEKKLDPRIEKIKNDPDISVQLKMALVIALNKSDDEK